MDILHKIVEKYGIDKFTHFGFGGEICSFFAILTYLTGTELTFSRWLTSCIVGTMFTFIFAYAKEMYDDTFDKKDLKWSMYGTLPVWAAFIIGTIVA